MSPILWMRERKREKGEREKARFVKNAQENTTIYISLEFNLKSKFHKKLQSFNNVGNDPL